MGHSAVLPAELILYTVGKEFGVLPWKLLKEDAADVMTTYAILREMQTKPQPKGNKRGI